LTISRGLAGSAAVLALAVTVSGCAGPTLTEQHYRSQASRSAGSAVSELETIRLAVRAQLNGRAWRQYTDVVVTDSEGALSSIDSTLSSRQAVDPAADVVAERVGTPLGDAVDLAGDVRTALRRHEDAQLRRYLPQLEQLSSRLEKLEQVVR
jgi:hypothetical protein